MRKRDGKAQAQKSSPDQTEGEESTESELDATAEDSELATEQVTDGPESSE